MFFCLFVVFFTCMKPGQRLSDDLDPMYGVGELVLGSGQGQTLSDVSLPQCGAGV